MTRCLKCGLYRQNPHLAWDSLKTYYPEDYASHPKLVQDEPNFLRRLDIRYGPWKRVRSIKRFQPNGNLLEIGCGTGLFLEEALRSGCWTVAGVEPSERAATYAREKLHVPIYQNRFSEVKLTPESYDLIVMWNVLEHLEHPIYDLRYAYQLLKERGWLILAIPNLEGFEASWFGPYWVGWDLPRHLYIFPLKILSEMLISIGFRWVTTRCISTSYAVLGHSLDFWSQSWETRYPLLRRLLLSLYHFLPVRALLLFPLWIFDRFNQSTIITIFAQKIPKDGL
jgi:SAM-dependent methyltransferase